MVVKKAAHSAYEIHYHFVMPLKYRKILMGKEIEDYFVWVCKEIEKRYEIEFERIGADKNHVHVLCSGAPRYAPSRIVAIIKSITAREIFKKFARLRKELWGGEFWSDGKYVGTVGEGGNKNVIERYIERQGSSPAEVQLTFWL